MKTPRCLSYLLRPCTRPSALLWLSLLTPLRAAETHFYREHGPANPWFSVPNASLYHALAADLDGDGDLDVLGTKTDFSVGAARLVWLTNTGTAAAPAFSGAVNTFTTFTLPFASSAALADLDADGDLDLVAGTPAGTFTYLRNTGSATAPTFTLVSGAASPFNGLDAGSNVTPFPVDIDGDGDRDFVCGDDALDRLVLLRNTGTPAAPAFAVQTFAPFAGITHDELVPALADTDGDGDLDLFVGQNLDGDPGVPLVFYRNTGTVAAPVYAADIAPLEYAIVPDAAAPVPADFDADGDADLLVSIDNSNLGLHFYRGAPPAPLRFTEETGAADPLAGHDYTFFASSDLDADGDSDLMACSDGPMVCLRNNGTATAPVWGAWPAPSPLAPLGLTSFSYVTLRDLDGDGDTDLTALMPSEGDYEYYLNTGSAAAPAFSLQSAAADPFAPISAGLAACGDVDGDGDADFVAGHWQDAPHALRYFRNTGTAAAPAFTEITGAQNPFALTSWMRDAHPALSDMDADGDLDLIVGGPGVLIYYRNDGTVTAPSFTLISGPASPLARAVPGAVYGAYEWWHPYAGEYKNGGARDLILGVYDFDTTETSTTRFFTGINAGPPTYEAWAVAHFGAPPPSNPAALPEADPDGDGHQNLVEFAVNTSPVIASEIPITHTTRTPGGLLQMALTVRNDDPVLAALSAKGEGSAALTGFSGSFPPAVTDPVPGDGYALWTFTDQPPPGANARRFLRAVFTVN